MHKKTLTGSWEFRQIDNQEWHPAQVPGCVQTDLLDLGMIPDPFVADNEDRVQWVAEADWEYRRTFDLSGYLLDEDRVYLVCDGLDTIAEVTLNRIFLAETNNMFRQYRWDITSIVKEKDNVLSIVFRSPVAYTTAMQGKRALTTQWFALPGSSYLRKAPCQFGWDWGPKLPPMGIWKDLRIEAYSEARIQDLKIKQYHKAGGVSIDVHAELERWSDQPISGLLRLSHPDGSVKEFHGEVDDTEIDFSIEVIDPQIWWPNGYGEQPLYQVEVEITSSQRLLDVAKRQVGLRTVELQQEEDDYICQRVELDSGRLIPHAHQQWTPGIACPGCGLRPSKHAACLGWWSLRI
jgi:beta-mannosidase